MAAGTSGLLPGPDPEQKLEDVIEKGVIACCEYNATRSRIGTYEPECKFNNRSVYLRILTGEKFIQLGMKKARSREHQACPCVYIILEPAARYYCYPLPVSCRSCSSTQSLSRTADRWHEGLLASKLET